MRTVVEVRHQLEEVCRREGVELASGGDSASIRRSLLAGLLGCVAEAQGDGSYLTVSGWLLADLAEQLLPACCGFLCD